MLLPEFIEWVSDLGWFFLLRFAVFYWVFNCSKVLGWLPHQTIVELILIHLVPVCLWREGYMACSYWVATGRQPQFIQFGISLFLCELTAWKLVISHPLHPPSLLSFSLSLSLSLSISLFLSPLHLMSISIHNLIILFLADGALTIVHHSNRYSLVVLQTWESYLKKKVVWFDTIKQDKQTCITCN